MELTTTQKQDLFRDGFVALPGAVPRGRVDNALHAINASLCGQGIDPAQLTRFRAQSYCPEVQATAAINDLVRASDILSLAAGARGRTLRVQRSPGRGAAGRIQWPSRGEIRRRLHGAV